MDESKAVRRPILGILAIFVLFILSVWSRSRPGRGEWIGAVAVSGGLAGFLLAANPAGGKASAAAGDWAQAATRMPLARAMHARRTLHGIRTSS